MALVPRPDSVKGDSREISGEIYILTLLQRLVRERPLVSVFFPDTSEHYTSTVLSIEPQAGYFLMDQVFPVKGQHLLRQSEHFLLCADLNGAALGFTSSVLARVEEGGLVYYRASFPKSINYLQRREGHRVQVRALDIPVELLDRQGKPCKGRLHDISPSGVGIQLDHAGSFENKEIYRLGIYPPNEAPIHAELEVCCLRQEEDSDTPILGGVFASLDKRAENNLGRLVAELERRLLRARWDLPSSDETAAAVK